jgi:hypothetical protein
MTKKSYYKIVIDTDLWRAFKSKCARDGKAMLAVLLKLIHGYTNGKYRN